jgi:PQQ-dependent dehydrogenase (methanol/ethanol family)
MKDSLSQIHRKDFPWSRGGRYLAGACALSSVLVAPLLWSQDSAANSKPDAEKTYAAQCAVCHGANARGGEYGPALTENDDLRDKSVEWFRDAIKNGFPTAGMPPFNLDAGELDALATLIHSYNSPASQVVVAGDRNAGERYFFGNGQCATCHMVNGRGSAKGPDLSSVARTMTLAGIRQSLLKPSATIAPGYELVTVKLRTGATLHGYARSRSNFEIALQDLDGSVHLLREREIAEITEDPQSAMPVVSATLQELQNLVAYLNSLTGVKPGNAEVADHVDSSGVSFSRIAHPQLGDWPTYNGNLSGNRYSELSQINTKNANQLTLKWIYTVPLWQQFYPDTSYFRDNLSYFGLEMTPLVADGIMYGTGPQQAYALDARTGHQIWSYTRTRTAGVVGDAALGTNRGLAILGDEAFMVTDDAHLLALNRTTGKLMWEVTMPEKPMHYGATVAPLVVKDMVIAGVAGGDWGIRGFVAAYRASDGKLLWRRWTIPDKQDPEARTWGGNPLETAGGATWLTGSYDPESDTLFWTAGNPYPDGDDRTRPGDNLYTNCILALDPGTGAIKWFYQVTPHDMHDWDATSPVVLVDASYQGRQRKLILYANKNGFFYVFDRTDGHVLLAKPFVRVNWATGIGADGVPQRVAEKGIVCPEAGTNWGATAFDPSTHFYYLMANEKCDVDLSAANPSGKPIKEEEARKYLEAIDISDGTVAWKIPELGPAEGKRNTGILATSGGLLFFGDPSGNFVAADARNGKPLWHFPTNGENKASPMTYSVDGKQYVGLAVGPNILVFGLP